MKTIKRIVLKEARVLSDDEMKGLFGGSAAQPKSCACTLLIGLPHNSGSYYHQVVPIIMPNPTEDLCYSECRSACKEYPVSGNIGCRGTIVKWDY